MLLGLTLNISFPLLDSQLSLLTSTNAPQPYSFTSLRKASFGSSNTFCSGVDVFRLASRPSQTQCLLPASVPNWPYFSFLCVHHAVFGKLDILDSILQQLQIESPPSPRLVVCFFIWLVTLLEYFGKIYFPSRVQPLVLLLSKHSLGHERSHPSMPMCLAGLSQAVFFLISV